MPIFACKLFQRVHLGKDFAIMPVSISDGLVELEITPCKGDPLMRAECLLQMLDEAWAQEEDQNLSDRPAFGHQSGSSDKGSLN